jgi:zinc transporter ZupT
MRTVFDVIAALLEVPMAAWAGFAAMTLWRWFVVPLGVPRVHLWQAAGIMLLAHLAVFTPEAIREDRTDDERLALGMTSGVLVPAIALALGALYHALS